MSTGEIILIVVVIIIIIVGVILIIVFVTQDDDNGGAAPTPTTCSTDDDCSSGEVCLSGTCVTAGSAGTGCQMDNDCLNPLICIVNVCQQPPTTCSTDSDCSSGEVCLNGSCVASGSAGTNCQMDNDCLNPLICTANICQQPPTGCIIDSDCSSGEVCLNGSCAASGSVGTPCTADQNCSAGLFCASDETCQILTGCRDDNDCPNDQICLADGTCVPQGSTGTPCTMDANCNTGLICGIDATCQIPPPLPPGTCRTNADCMTDQVCTNSRCVGTLGARCTQNADCDTDLTCIAGVCSTPPAFPNGTACSADSDCQSDNCSFSFCQATQTVSGQTNAVCSTGANSPPLGIGCTTGFQCTSSTCSPTGSALTFRCSMDTDCNPFNVCQANPYSTTGSEVCIYRDDPNICPTGICAGGYECSNPAGTSSSSCMGFSGIPCTINANCLSGNCSTTGEIVRWNGQVWNPITALPNGIAFNRIVAITRGAGDDLWGLDLNNGVYYWPHDGSPMAWRKVANATFSQNLDTSGFTTIGSSNNRDFAIVDLAVTPSNLPYVMYSVTDPNNSANPTVTVLYTLNIAATPVSMNPLQGPSGIIYRQGLPNQPSRVPIMANNLDVSAYAPGGNYILIYGQQLGFNLQTFSFWNLVTRQLSGAFQPELAFNFPQTQNTMRIIPRLTGVSLPDFYRYIFNADDEPNQLQSSAIFSSTPLPPSTTDLIISDYAVALSSTSTPITYIVANDPTMDDMVNLFIIPSAIFGDMYILPGYIDSSSRISATTNDLYMYSARTCT